METRLENILKPNNLSVTDCRKKILQFFLSQKDALAHGDIEHRSEHKFDRVTVYRTLQAFVDKSIFIPFRLQIMLYDMRYAKMIVQEGCIWIITFILFAHNAAPPIVLTRWLHLK